MNIKEEYLDVVFQTYAKDGLVHVEGTYDGAVGQLNLSFNGVPGPLESAVAFGFQANPNASLNDNIEDFKQTLQLRAAPAVKAYNNLKPDANQAFIDIVTE